MDFKNKTAISTGAASGMGLLFAQNFADLGGNLGCCMYLCVHEYDKFATKMQPLLKNVKPIRDNMWKKYFLKKKA